MRKLSKEQVQKRLDFKKLKIIGVYTDSKTKTKFKCLFDNY